MCDINFVNKIFAEQIFCLQFSLNLLPPNHPKQNINIIYVLLRHTLYINIAVASITKIYHCWLLYFRYY